MTGITASRVTGRIGGDFVVFLIGMRINKPWKVHKWLPAARHAGLRPRQGGRGGAGSEQQRAAEDRGGKGLA